jgi:hypothetical protein
VVLFLLHFLFCILYTAVNLQDRDSYWKMMHKYKGVDVTSLVTLPVIIFEPMTMLPKMAEVGTLILNEIPLCLYSGVVSKMKVAHAI